MQISLVLMRSLALAVMLYVSLWVEKLASKNRLAENVTVGTQSAILLSIILTPIAVIEHQKIPPISGFFLLFCSIIAFMKMISYVLVNRDYRVAQRKKVQLIDPIHPHVLPNPQRYPDNLRARNLLYFLAAPTLIYQINYPRSPSVRRLWLVGKVTQLVVFLFLMKILVDQYVMPAVKNAKVRTTHKSVYSLCAQTPLEELAWLKIVERVLKLSVCTHNHDVSHTLTTRAHAQHAHATQIPNLYIWLLMFYCFFHLWLNILAELLRFGDRAFYKDWWNAESLGTVSFQSSALCMHVDTYVCALVSVCQSADPAQIPTGGRGIFPYTIGRCATSTFRCCSSVCLSSAPRTSCSSSLQCFMRCATRTHAHAHTCRRDRT